MEDEDRIICKRLSEKSSLRIIANYVSQVIQRKMNTAEIKELRHKIRELSSRYVGEKLSLDDMQQDMAAMYADVIKSRTRAPKALINTHEMLKKEILDENTVVHKKSKRKTLKHENSYLMDADGRALDYNNGIFGEQPFHLEDGTIAYASDEESCDEDCAITHVHVPHGFIRCRGKMMTMREYKRYGKKIRRGDNLLEPAEAVHVMETPRKPPFFKEEFVWHRDAYMLIDSRFRDRSRNDTGKYHFTIDGIGFTESNGGIKSPFELEDIVAMQIEKFDLPYDENYTNFFEKGTLLVQQMNLQSIQAHQNIRYHWMFDVSLDTVNKRQTWTPIQKKYVFNEPITRLSEMTLVFRHPFELTPFFPDCLRGQIVLVAGFGTNPLRIEFTEPHNLDGGAVIWAYVEDFGTHPGAAAGTDPTTGDAAVDAILRDGLTARDIAVVDPTTISLTGVDGSNVTNDNVVEICFGSKQIIIPIRFKCLSRGKNTNYLHAVEEHV